MRMIPRLAAALMFAMLAVPMARAADFPVRPCV